MTELFWIIVCIHLVAIIFILCGFFYKKDLIKKWIYQCHEFFFEKPISSEILAQLHENITKQISNFNKLIISALVVTFIVVLLILKIIHAESGLPIITAIAGYVLADNSSNNKSIFKKEKEDKNNKE